MPQTTLKKPGCFICGNIGDETTYYYWEGKGMCHIGCAIDCDFTIKHQDKEEFNPNFVDIIIKDKDIEILEKKSNYIDFLVHKVYQSYPMNREMIKSYILGRYK